MPGEHPRGRVGKERSGCEIAARMTPAGKSRAGRPAAASTPPLPGAVETAAKPGGRRGVTLGELRHTRHPPTAARLGGCEC